MRAPGDQLSSLPNEEELGEWSQTTLPSGTLARHYRSDPVEAVLGVSRRVHSLPVPAGPSDRAAAPVHVATYALVQCRQIVLASRQVRGSV